MRGVAPALQPQESTDPREFVMNDMHYKLMRLLEANPEMSQRDIARELNISLGKVNYCLRALIDRGWLKVNNFTNSQNKAAYMYLLTPRGIEQKATLAVRFLKAKLREYEALRLEIDQIRRETADRLSAEEGSSGVVARKLRDASVR